MNEDENKHRIIPGIKKPRKSKVLQRASDIAFRGLLAAGVPIGKAAKLLGFHPTTGSRIKKRLEQQGEDVSALVSASRDEKLKKLIDKYLEEGVKMRNIKPSDVIAAAKLYADRGYPVRQEPPAPAVSFVRVDISAYSTDRKNEKAGTDEEPGRVLREGDAPLAHCLQEVVCGPRISDQGRGEAMYLHPRTRVRLEG